MLKTYGSIMVVLCFLVLTQPISASIGKSLVAHWTFDEGTGTDLKDASGNGHNGEIKGEIKWIDGAFEKYFDWFPIHSKNYHFDLSVSPLDILPLNKHHKH